MQGDPRREENRQRVETSRRPPRTGKRFLKWLQALDQHERGIYPADSSVRNSAFRHEDTPVERIGPGPTDWQPADTSILGEMPNPVRDGQIREEGIDRLLAYYRPFHFGPGDWGIYILESGLIYLAQKLRSLMPGNPDISTLSREELDKILRSTWMKLYLHELGHFLSECWVTQLEMDSGQPQYSNYWNRMHVTRPHPEVGAEAAANWFALASMAHWRGWGRIKMEDRIDMDKGLVPFTKEAEGFSLSEVYTFAKAHQPVDYCNFDRIHQLEEMVDTVTMPLPSRVTPNQLRGRQFELVARRTLRSCPVYIERDMVPRGRVTLSPARPIMPVIRARKVLSTPSTENLIVHTLKGFARVDHNLCPVEVSSLEDLAKAAKIRSLPILHNLTHIGSKTFHTYAIVDIAGGIFYTFSRTEERTSPQIVPSSTLCSFCKKRPATTSRLDTLTGNRVPCCSECAVSIMT